MYVHTIRQANKPLNTPAVVTLVASTAVDLSVKHRSGVCPSVRPSVCSVRHILKMTHLGSAPTRPLYVSIFVCDSHF